MALDMYAGGSATFDESGQTPRRRRLPNLLGQATQPGGTVGQPAGLAGLAGLLGQPGGTLGPLTGQPTAAQAASMTASIPGATNMRPGQPGGAGFSQPAIAPAMQAGGNQAGFGQQLAGINPQIAANLGQTSQTLPGGQTQGYGPGQSLIGQQITAGPEGASPTGLEFAKRQLGALEAAPSRSKTAMDLYRTLEAGTLPELQAGIRAAGQRGAALGRLGSGMVSEDVGDVFRSREANLANIRARLAAETAGAERGDILNAIGAGQNVGGQEFDIGSALRGELRGERGYQAGQDQQAIENRIRQKELEERLLSGEFGREFQTAGLMGSYGFDQSPTGLAISQLLSGQSGDTQAAIAELLRSRGLGG